ncbi:UDP-glycosyltransferase 88F4-like [Macadamia integrifolia]|uniref:UDP-glycosyltransferase 88F4-like n=1 Tax=Macadamia integrifolia TaxID=60698 RepID=UPI001C4F4EB4|nr:UDP-glycosyltransferase 88F4-like [Macadamia integrifolia]
MEGTVVIYPIMTIGHLVSMVELGNLILRQYHHRFSVTVLITTDQLFITPDVTAFLRRVSKATPSITFHHLPSLSIPSSSIEPSPNRSRLAVRGELIRSNNPNLIHALQTISETSTVRALIIDFFCVPGSYGASDLGFPTYYYIPAGAIFLSLLLHLPTIHSQTTKSFKHLTTTHLHFPGLPPVRASHMPEPMLDRDDQVYHYMLEIGNRLPKSTGIIVNTFESLESKVIKAITDGLCIPDVPTPPVYCIGPLIDSPDTHSLEGESINQCLSWLDAQPSQRVVFLCFGSRGVFSKTQVKEIAVGLEKSGQRFLWVLRKPLSEDNNKHMSFEREDLDLDVLLPEGFLERTHDRGLVVKEWAPQVEVLSKESVGGFVTHCGWNSVLEAVSAGVPMVAWPLYAEQHMNRTVLVEQMKLAMPMEASKDGMVSAVEVEKRVRALIESEEGRVSRERSRKTKEEAVAAWSAGGSSMIAFTKLADSWIY